jgi:hypothetical protein
MLNVNTIEFGGRKACINSYSDHPLLAENMNRQAEAWRLRYPKAIVRTERMSEADTIALVAYDRLGPLRSLPHEIGKASQEA